MKKSTLTDYTDIPLAELEHRIKDTYEKARKDLAREAKDYFKRLEARAANMRKLVESGAISEDHYKRWYVAQVGRGKRFEILRDRCVDRITNAAKVAVDYVNDSTPIAVAMGHNYTGYEVNKLGYRLDTTAAIDSPDAYAFTIWNENTVRELLVDNPQLLPKAAVDIPKEQQWNRDKITSTVTNAVLRGKGPMHIADEIVDVVGGDFKTALRTARTAYTAAQNIGALDGMNDLVKRGLKLKKTWLATKDERTRISHRDLDGQTVDVDQMFKSILGSRMMCPGDSSHGAVGADIYNCRCCMQTKDKYDEYDESIAPRKMRVREQDENGKYVLKEIQKMTYKQWMESKGLDIYGKKLQDNEE